MNPRTQRHLAIAALYAAVATIFCAPLLSHPFNLGTGDWDQHLFYYAQVLKNVVEYGQAPFWSPWYCAGDVMWQNPQVALLSPAYPLTALMPLALAMKVNIVLHYWIGLIGMHLLCTRVLGIRFTPAVVLVSSIFVLSGSLALHLAAGHSVFLPAFYLPLQMMFALQAMRTGTLRYAYAAAGILALTIANGGLHIVPMQLLAVGACSLCLAAAHRSLRPIAVALVIGVGGSLYAAPKLLPVVNFVKSEHFWDTRLPTAHPDRMTGAMIWRAYTDASQGAEGQMDGLQRFEWWEYGNYVSTAVVILIIAAIIASLAMPVDPRRELARTSAVVSVMFLALSAGEFHSLAPAVALRHVPLFSSFRIPSRFTIGAVLFGAMTLGAVSGSLLERLKPARWLQSIAAAACILMVLQIGTVNRRQFRTTFSNPPLSERFHFLAGSKALVRDVDTSPWAPNAPMLRALMSGRGLYWCYESLQVMRRAATDEPLVWTRGDAQLSRVVFTPNRVQFSVAGGLAPTDVFLNQNYADGWRSTAGAIALDQRSGRMFVRLTPGRTGRFEFYFIPPGLMAATILFILGISVSAVTWRRCVPVMRVA